MKQCSNCSEPAEGSQYQFCYNCWWMQDPRNKDKWAYEENQKKIKEAADKPIKTMAEFSEAMLEKYREVMGSDKPTIIINSPKHKDTNKTYKEFLGEWEGSIMCGCDHGCNQWLARNAAKMMAINVAMYNDMNDLGALAPDSVLDEMAQRPALEYGKELYKKMRDEAMAARKKKRETD